MNESEESEKVFFYINNTESESTMPPKVPPPPNPQTLFQDFENKLEDWRQMYEEAVEFGEIPKGMMDDLTDCCKSIESICRNIQKLEPDHDT